MFCNSYFLVSVLVVLHECVVIRYFVSFAFLMVLLALMWASLKSVNELMNTCEANVNEMLTISS